MGGTEILVIGIIGFNKLVYWDRSVRIFSFNSDVPFEGRGRGGRGQGDRGFEGREGGGGREGFTRSEMRELPDSLRAMFEAREGRHGEGRERGEFRGGKKINFRNVQWFLAVFASFTVIVIYMDIGYILICRKK